jgi:hypothetical protein
MTKPQLRYCVLYCMLNYTVFIIYYQVLPYLNDVQRNYTIMTTKKWQCASTGFCSCAGGSELAYLPGQRGADPGGKERGAGPGVRRCAWVALDGAGGGGAAVHGARCEARHGFPGREAVNLRPSCPRGLLVHRISVILDIGVVVL